MRCQKCNGEFLEENIQLSHDIPKYMDGLDSDGRHYLCTKCHDIYERLGFSIAIKCVDNDTKKIMREKVKKFSQNYFREVGDETNS